MAISPMFAYVDARDQRILGRLSGWRPPRWFRVWMLWASRLGDGWLWVSVGALLAIGGASTARALGAAALSASAANAAVVLLKGRVKRTRPSEQPSNSFFALGGNDRLRCDAFSFPSGHALNAFALAAVVGPAFPAAWPVVGFLAASIAASRVVLGVHFLSDVLAGAVLGTVIGGASYLAVFA
jgi:undecaprenyl-diphosphatase